MKGIGIVMEQEPLIKLVDTKEYVSMLRELTEQGHEVSMIVSGNSRNRDSVAKNSALIEELIAAVPIYELGCTISEEAVICLKSILYP